MLVLNDGTDHETTLRVVLESEEHGREYFDDYDSLDEMVATVKHLVESSLTLAGDGVEQIVAIAIIPKSEYGNPDAYGFDLEDRED